MPMRPNHPNNLSQSVLERVHTSPFFRLFKFACTTITNPPNNLNNPSRGLLNHPNHPNSPDSPNNSVVGRDEDEGMPCELARLYTLETFLASSLVAVGIYA